MMAGIRGTNTKPEMAIRRGLHALGFRYRLHGPKLPGRPDLVLPRYRAVVFVHGCFWHGHACNLFRWPSTRQDFWREKIEGNRDRDRDTVERLEAAGWEVMVVWSHEEPAVIADRIGAVVRQRRAALASRTSGDPR